MRTRSSPSLTHPPPPFPFCSVLHPLHLQVSREFLAVLGAEKLPYLQLVHQLIVCEEQWEGEAHK